MSGVYSIYNTLYKVQSFHIAFVLQYPNTDDVIQTLVNADFMFRVTGTNESLIFLLYVKYKSQRGF